MSNESHIWGGKPSYGYRIVSWYTPTYERVAQRFAESLRRIGRDVLLYQYESTGNWYANVARKPDFLLRALDDTPHDIVYIDADAIVHAPLRIFDEWTGEMLGAHYRMRPGKEPELLGGTLYLRNHDALRIFLKDCRAYMAMTAARGEAIYCQRAMADLLPSHPDITIRPLPVEYCTIYDGVDRPASGIVIEHMQESRKQCHGSI